MIQEKQLAQKRENSTNAVSVYSPGAGITAVIKNILVSNTTGADAFVDIYCDDDGSTYDESTALLFGTKVKKNGGFVEITSFVAMNNPAGNLAYKSSLANALTITVFGAEIT